MAKRSEPRGETHTHTHSEHTTHSERKKKRKMLRTLCQIKRMYTKKKTPINKHLLTLRNGLEYRGWLSTEY